MDKISQARATILTAQILLSDIKRVPEITELLQEALKAEFQQWDLYYAYKDELRGLSRDPIVDHFKEHADDEAEHISILQRYLVSMGVQPTKQRDTIPEIDALRPEAIIQLQLQFEVRAVETYRKLLSLLEETDPLKIEIENILAKEMEHAQDLELYLQGREQKKESDWEKVQQELNNEIVDETDAIEPRIVTQKQKALQRIRFAQMQVQLVATGKDVILSKKLAASRKAMKRSAFLMQFGYHEGDPNFKFTTKRQLQSAIKNFVDGRVLILASILSNYRTAFLSDNAEERYRKYVKKFGQWYVETKQHWKEFLKEAKHVEGFNDAMAKGELNKFFEDPKYDEFLQTGIDLIDEHFGSFMQMLKANVDSEALQSPEITKIIKEFEKTKDE
jgi:bacterioferritin (cytochrome b1)